MIETYEVPAEVSSPGILIPAQESVHQHASPTTYVEWPAEPGRGLLFGGSIHPKLRIQAPISLKVRLEQGLVTVTSEELEEFGSGSTLGDALGDLSRTLAELYFTLEEEQNRLGPELHRIWTVLKIKITPRG